MFKTIPKKRKDGEFESDLEYAFLFRKGRFSFPWIYVIDRKFFLKKRIKFLEGTYFEDHFFNIQLLYYCHRVRIIPHALYNYRLHDLSITGNATPQKILDIYDVYEKIKLFLINKNIFKLYKELFYARYLTYCVYRSFERYWSITDKEKKIRIYLKKVQSSSLLEDNNLKSLKKITLSIPNNENIKRDYLEAYYNLKLIKKHYFWFNIFSFFKIKIWYKLKNGSNRF